MFANYAFKRPDNPVGKRAFCVGGSIQEVDLFQEVLVV